MYLNIYICITESLCCTPETTQHCKLVIFQLKKKFDSWVPPRLADLEICILKRSHTWSVYTMKSEEYSFKMGKDHKVPVQWPSKKDTPKTEQQLNNQRNQNP